MLDVFILTSGSFWRNRRWTRAQHHPSARTPNNARGDHVRLPRGAVPLPSRLRFPSVALSLSDPSTTTESEAGASQRANERERTLRNSETPLSSISRSATRPRRGLPGGNAERRDQRRDGRRGGARRVAWVSRSDVYFHLTRRRRAIPCRRRVLGIIVRLKR